MAGSTIEIWWIVTLIVVMGAAYSWPNVAYWHGATVKKNSYPDMAPPERQAQNPPGWYNILDHEFRSLSVRPVTLEVPEEMVQGETYTIIAHLDSSIKNELVALLISRGLHKLVEVQISEWMQVELTGNGFEIIPLHKQQQQVTVTSNLQWQWQVTPGKTGNKKLKLKGARVIKMPAGNAIKRHPVLDNVIKVHGNKLYTVKGTFMKHWPLFVFAPVLVCLMLLRYLAA